MQTPEVTCTAQKRLPSLCVSGNTVHTITNFAGMCCDSNLVLGLSLPTNHLEKDLIVLGRRPTLVQRMHGTQPLRVCPCCSITAARWGQMLWILRDIRALWSEPPSIHHHKAVDTCSNGSSNECPATHSHAVFLPRARWLHCVIHVITVLIHVIQHYVRMYVLMRFSAITILFWS